MTIFKPNLQLSKIRIMSGANSAYSAEFHSGINIISGQNASGKSTIMDFIFYGLGGEDIPWKTEALSCTDVFLEVEINGAPITLRRDINTERRSPLMIFWERLDKAILAPHHEWESYPYQRSIAKESFSQILFRALELPELRGESASNITMHQILRLMYVDQRTPHDEIFRNEPFDTQLTRETVGNYLCGVHSDELYSKKLELKSVEVALENAVSTLRNLFSVLGKSGHASTIELLDAEEKDIFSALSNHKNRLLEIKSPENNFQMKIDSPEKVIDDKRLKLSVFKKRYAEKSKELTELELESSDSLNFINEIERRIYALNESDKVRDYFGKITFKFCPCCFSAVEKKIVSLDGNVANSDSEKEQCALCKESVDNEIVNSHLMRMKNELSIQKAESLKIQQRRADKISKIKSELPSLRNSLRRAEKDFDYTSKNWSSPTELEIEKINIQIGELNQRLKQLGEKQRLALIVEELQVKRDNLEKQKARIIDRIVILENSSYSEELKAAESIRTHLANLLRKDLPRQEEFIKASNISWNFSSNKVSVNGQNQFSESSMVILKQCFHSALLAASCDLEFFRYPRFLLLDGIDDGGQELSRSHNLQKTLIGLSASLKTSHQIIFATSQISPKFDNPKYVVGKKSTTESKTLFFK